MTRLEHPRERELPTLSDKSANIGFVGGNLLVACCAERSTVLVLGG